MVIVEVLICVLVTLLVKNLWKNRWLYYYAFKIPGPFSWPLIGSAYVLLDRHNDLYKTLMKQAEQNPAIFKIWMGSYLVIINSNPKDVEICLNSCLQRTPVEGLAKPFLGNGLLTAPVEVWKRHRKLINPAFNSTVLTSFLNIFEKHSIELVEQLRNCSSSIDVFPKIRQSTLNIACETLADIDPTELSEKEEYLKNIMRIEENLKGRVISLWLHPTFIWKRSTLGKEFKICCNKTFEFIKQLLETKKLHAPPTDFIRKQIFLNRIMHHSYKNISLTEREMVEETQTLLITASESTAITTSSVLLVLGIYKDVQEKVYQELCSIFGNSTRNLTMEDLNRMVYLEAVIKETLRLLPTIPIIVRYAHEDLKIDGKVFPKDSIILIPIAYMNKREDLWTDPQVFNPNRFLSEEIKYQHRCTFIPFSFGPRNCIGLKYGMISMKTMLSTVVRHFKMYCLHYKSIDEIDISYSAVAKAKSYVLQLDPRTNNKEF